MKPATVSDKYLRKLTMSREERIRAALTQAFSPVTLEVHNESHLHAGHAGDDGSGESHFRIMVVSQVFTRMKRVDRHRKVFEALQEEMQHIHALSIETHSPDDLKSL